jgi:hypothetical protein
VCQLTHQRDSGSGRSVFIAKSRYRRVNDTVWLRRACVSAKAVSPAMIWVHAARPVCLDGSARRVRTMQWRDFLLGLCPSLDDRRSQEKEVRDIVWQLFQVDEDHATAR